MTLRRPLSILGLSLWLAPAAVAQTPLAPPPGMPPPVQPAAKPAEKAKPKPPAPPPAAAKKPDRTPAPAAPVTPTPVPNNPNVDLVFGAYHRDEYKPAFGLAEPRAKA